MGHNTLPNYYETMFALVQHHKWSWDELENRYPFEITAIVGMLQKHLTQVKEAQQKAKYFR
jgi:hypothetical protein